MGSIKQALINYADDHGEGFLCGTLDDSVLYEMAVLAGWDEHELTPAEIDLAKMGGAS